jgi:hypothetical protein
VIVPIFDFILFNEMYMSRIICNILIFIPLKM